MWEVFTEGQMPFEQNQNHEVVTLVTMGHRLFRPKMATPAMYDIMQMCWHEVRAMRNNMVLFICKYSFNTSTKPGRERLNQHT